MSTQAQSMLNKFSQISQNVTAPTGSACGANSHDTDLPPAQHVKINFSLDELLNGIHESLLPPLALADGSDEFNGDATNDWVYPGRYLRGGILPDVDLVTPQVLEITKL